MQGDPVGLVARFERADGGKEFRPLRAVKQPSGKVLWSLGSPPAPRPLYRLAALHSEQTKPVLICEGEKTAEAAAARFTGYVATTWMGGANAVDKTDCTPLRGRTVVIWPDNDDAGREAAQRIAQALTKVGAAKVAIVQLPPDLPPKWDVADPTPEGLDLDGLLTSAIPLSTGQALRPFVLTAGDLVELKLPPREHLIDPFLALPSLSMLYAERGIGKTFFALTLALAVARGEDFLGYRVPRKGNVLIIDGEMPLVELQERLTALSMGLVPGMFVLPSELLFREGKPLNISSPQDQKRIVALLDDLKREGFPIHLIILDNLSSLSAGIDENDNNALDGFLRWLVTLKLSGYAVLLVHHAGKSGDQRGASRREDLLDTSIKLRKPDPNKDHSSPHAGAHFFLEFVKTRGKRPVPDVLELRLTDTGDSLAWQVNNAPAAGARDRTLREIAVGKHKTQKALAEAIGLSQAAISKHITALRSAGLVEENRVKTTVEGNERVLQLWPELWNVIAKQETIPM